MGMATVASSSAAAGQTTRRVKRIFDDGSFESIKDKEFRNIPRREMAVDAVLGMCTFKVEFNIFKKIY